MKISELVEKLMDIQGEYGDINVVYPDGRDGFDDESNDIESIEIIDTGDKILEEKVLIS